MELLLNRQKLCTMCILDTCLIKKKGKNSKVAVLIKHPNKPAELILAAM